MSALIAALLFFLPPPARAWDVARADIDKRVNELDHVWGPMRHDAVTADIIGRSKQDQQPDWVGRSSWKAAIGGKSYGFAVGSSRRVKNPEKRIAKAESEARAALGALMGRKDKVPAAILDWYEDEDGVFSALAAVEFAGSAPPEAPEPLPPPSLASGKPIAAPPSAPTLTAEDYLAQSDEALAAKDYESAEKSLASAEAQLASDDWRRVRYFEGMGRIALARKELDKSRQFYTDGIKLAQALRVQGPLRADLFAGLGYCLAAQKNAAYARKFLERALELDPSEATRAAVEKQLRALP